jgi:hypothetical protein
MTTPGKSDPGQRGFRDDCRGSVIIEFTYVLPILIALFAGGFAVSRGFFAMQKVDFIAHNLADLTARTTDCNSNAARACLDAGDVNDIFDAAKALVSPLPNTNLKMTISEVGVLQGLAGRTVETSWSIARGGAEVRSCNSAPVLPPGFTAATAPLGAIIIVDVSYRFWPGYGFESYDWTFTRSHYAVSRDLTPAPAMSNLPNGHIRNDSGEGTNCKQDPP